jgi:phytoene dehydrogenase-like protein
VHLDDGRRWRTRRAVLADVAVPALYRDLLRPTDVPPGLLADLRGFRFDSSTVKVDWALSRPVPWRAASAAGAGTVHLGADLDGLPRYAAALESGRVPEPPMLICGQMTTADPLRSPAGTESLWAYTHLPHQANWDAAVVRAVAGRMEQELERHAPGFSASIVGRHVAGPNDLSDENANLVGGALGGGTAAIHQQLIFRPMAGLGRADTPIDGLFLASAGAHPGGGVHGAPGANAARAALARCATLTGPLYGASMRMLNRRLYRR